MNDELQLLLRQDKRIASFNTPLGKNRLVLTRFEGVEGLSELFEYQVDALSAEPNLNFDTAIGEECSVTFKTYGGGERWFNGVLAQAQWLGGGDEKTYAYRLWLRPSLWLLSQTADCRIFKNKTAPEIIKKVLGEHGVPFEEKLSENHPTREYCVQYRETDLAFLSRLMEEEGIYYFFKQTPGEHKLVLADSMSAHEAIEGAATLPFIALAGQDRRAREHIYEWHSERRFRTAKLALDAYDPMKPSTDLAAESEANPKYRKLEVFDYPGRYMEKGDGEHYAKIRVQAAQAQDNRRQAAGDAISLVPGGLFTLERYGATSENKQYLVVRASHSYTSPERYRTGGGSEPDQIYYGNYDLLLNDSNKPFRAPFVTPTPLVHGPQTAMVITEEEGEEIDIDDHGRIMVRFHWERGAEKEEKYSRRVRVSQVWSGKSWGGQFIPRVGHEVVVIFLEGNPDEPLVVGTVYNNESKYPYEKKAKKTQSGWKTYSTKGGGGYNEFRFEDKKGSEEVYMRAEKDHNVLVRNKETWNIGEAFKTPVGSPSRHTTIENGDDQLDIKMGDWKVKAHMGAIEIEAMKSITLKVGMTKIVLDQLNIKMESTFVEAKGTATMDVKSPLTTVKGDAILTLKGGLTLIN